MQTYIAQSNLSPATVALNLIRPYCTCFCECSWHMICHCKSFLSMSTTGTTAEPSNDLNSTKDSNCILVLSCLLPLYSVTCMICGVKNYWEERIRKELNEAKHNVCTQRQIPVDDNDGNQVKEHSNQACQ